MPWGQRKGGHSVGHGGQGVKLPSWLVASGNVCYRFHREWNWALHILCASKCVRKLLSPLRPSTCSVSQVQDSHLGRGDFEATLTRGCPQALPISSLPGFFAWDCWVSVLSKSQTQWPFLCNLKGEGPRGCPTLLASTSSSALHTRGLQSLAPASLPSPCTLTITVPTAPGRDWTAGVYPSMGP